MVLTTECNLQCSYCFGEAQKDFDAVFSYLEIDYALPKTISYDLKLLNKFCRQDPHCVIIFYGGEPLLRVDDIKNMMDSVKAEHFLIQTNGLLLDHLDACYVNRFSAILVSLDGDEALTDLYRGKDTFQRVVSNLQFIRQSGFNGELIARMTVMEQTDIYKQVRWLLENPQFPFSSVHWQLNAGFWNKDSSHREFEEWSKDSYNPGVQKLAEFWVDSMEEDGIVLRLYPFLGVVQSLLSGEKIVPLRCGGGWVNYAIQTDGQIVPCPSMWGIKEYYLGHISNSNPLTLKKTGVGEPCTKCDIFNICGGRCLYANVTRRWNAVAYKPVCDTVKNLVEALTAQAPRITGLIERGRISTRDFEFMKFNGCEIIP